MRIRKHANILIQALIRQEQESQAEQQPQAPLVAPSAPLRIEKLLLCELNMYPWDIITFKSSESDFFYSHWLRKVKREGGVKYASKVVVNRNNGAGGVSVNAGITVKSEVDITHQLAIGKAQNGKPLAEDIEVLEMLKKGLKKKTGFKKLNEKSSAAETLPSDSSQNVKTKKGKLTGKPPILCNKADGKGWRCKKPTENGNVLCRHHVEQLRAYQALSKSNSKEAKPETKAKPKAEKLKPVEMPLPAEEPPLPSSRRVRKKAVDDYYYSGFGPRWGKRKSDEGIKDDELLINLVNQDVKDFKPQAIKEESDDVPWLNVVAPAAPSASTTPPEAIQPSKVVDHDVDLGNILSEEDDDDDDDNYYNASVSVGQKRARKPVKERSLKSLF